MNREIVLVTGMHRCGTSALTRVLDLVGATLPQPLVPPALGNELGHWESAEALRINERILAAAGAEVNDVLPFAHPELAPPLRDAFVEEVREWLDRATPRDGLSVVKDPRMAILAPIWREAVERLGLRPRFVICWRDPWEAARSLTTRQIARFPNEVWPQERAVLLWLKHQLFAERATRGALRSFVSYHALTEDWRSSIERLFAQLELSTQPGSGEAFESVELFLTPDARRWRKSPTEAASPKLADDVADLLETLADDPSGAAAAFDGVAQTVDSACATMGGYVRALETRIDEDASAQASDDTHALLSALRLMENEVAVRAMAEIKSAAATPEVADDFADLRAAYDGLRLIHGDIVAERNNLSDVAAELRQEFKRAAFDLAAAREGKAEVERALRQANASRESLFEERNQLAKEVARLQTDIMNTRSEAAASASKATATSALMEEAKGVCERKLTDALARLEAERSMTERSATERSAAERRLADMADELILERAGVADRFARERAAAMEWVDLARAEIRAERALRLAAEREVNDLRNSRSWRMTRLVRSVTFRLRRLLGR